MEWMPGAALNVVTLNRRRELLKAHELAQKLLDGPDLEVVYVEYNEYGSYYNRIDDVEEVTKKQSRLCEIPVPYVQLV